MKKKQSFKLINKIVAAYFAILFILQGPDVIRVSRFYKDAKQGKFVSYLHPDATTLYESFRRGAKVSSEFSNH